MTGKQVAVILYAAVALYDRRGKIAELDNNSRRDSGKTEPKIAVTAIKPGVYDKQIHQSYQHGTDHTAHSACHSLFGGNIGAKLALAEQLSRIHRHSVAYPRGNKHKEIQLLPRISYRDYAVYTESDIKAYKSDKSKDSKIITAVFGILLIGIGIFLIANPFETGKIARIAIGIAVILLGAFNFLVAHTIAQRNKNASSDVINVSDYNVSDDHKLLK